MARQRTGATTADILIIGGGIAGVSLAARAARHGRVVLLEAEAHPGYHATGRSAAVFVPNYGGPVVRELTALGRAAFDRPDRAFFPETLLSPRGLLRLVKPGGEAIYAEAMGDATDIESIPIEEACRRFPLMRPERFTAASYEEDVHDIDVDALLQGLLKLARAGGAEVRVGRAVSRIERDAGAWRVTTAEGNFVAPTLVNAAGAWADHIAALAGLPPVGLRPFRRSVALLPMPDLPDGGEHLPMTVTFPLDWYAKTESGRLLVSTAEEVEVAPQDVMVDDLALAEGLYRFEEDTSYAVRRVLTHWAGLRTVSPDGLPVVGYDPLADGFFWFAGQAGFGIQTAPALASVAAADLVGEDAELKSEIAPARFR